MRKSVQMSRTRNPRAIPNPPTPRQRKASKKLILSSTGNTDCLRGRRDRQRGVDASLDQDVIAGRSRVRIGDGSHHVVRRAVVIVVRELVAIISQAKGISNCTAEPEK